MNVFPSGIIPSFVNAVFYWNYNCTFSLAGLYTNLATNLCTFVVLQYYMLVAMPCSCFTYMCFPGILFVESCSATPQSWKLGSFKAKQHHFRAFHFHRVIMIFRTSLCADVPEIEDHDAADLVGPPLDAAAQRVDQRRVSRLPAHLPTRQQGSGR